MEFELVIWCGGGNGVRNTMRRGGAGYCRFPTQQRIILSGDRCMCSEFHAVALHF